MVAKSVKFISSTYTVKYVTGNFVRAFVWSDRWIGRNPGLCNSENAAKGVPLGNLFRQLLGMFNTFLWSSQQWDCS